MFIVLQVDIVLTLTSVDSDYYYRHGPFNEAQLNWCSMQGLADADLAKTRI